MAIINTQSANGFTGATITTPNINDLILVYSWRAANSTMPTAPAGYTDIDTRTGVAPSGRIAYRLSDGTETDVGTWTNSTGLLVSVYRWVDPADPIGGFASSFSTFTTSVSYPTVTMEVTDGTSWIVGGVGHTNSTGSTIQTSPSGMNLRQFVKPANASNQAIAMHDTGSGVVSWSTQTVSQTSSGDRCCWTVELRADPNAPDLAVGRKSLLGVGV